MTTRFTHSLLAGTALLALAGYECNDVIEDPGFDLWCGDTLCAWELEKGEIARVPTWNTRDYGVALVSETVALSQRADTSPRCLRFQFLADVAYDAEVTVELDLFADGNVEWERQVPTSDWALLEYYVTLPPNYRGLLFRSRKTGSGRAVLAEIEAITSTECTAPPIQALPRDAGAGCAEASDCVSRLCGESFTYTGWGNTGTCASCAEAGDCPADQVCGVSADAGLPVTTHLHETCVAPASASFGSQCATDAECATGVCCQARCSTCCDGEGCGEGVDCVPRDTWGYNQPPHQCAPGPQPDGGCLTDDDCATGTTCVGGSPQGVCSSDGRWCHTDEDCPRHLGFLQDDPGVCWAVGIPFGTCE